MIKLGLFTKGANNTKLAKGRGSGYETIGLFLSPHTANSSRVNLCPFASAACISACLNTSGLAGIFPRILQARKRKSDLFLADRSAFIERLKEEIVVYDRRATKHGKRLAVRLNGTSDIDFPASIFSSFPKIQFYDYTKSPYKMSKYLCGNLPPNYHVTFSYSGENLEECHNILARGGNVAAVFSSNDFPHTWQGYKVKTGEESDLRFLDRGPVVIGLKAKGRAKKERSQFIIQIAKGKS
jgi:hypothetical protein